MTYAKREGRWVLQEDLDAPVCQEHLEVGPDCVFCRMAELRRRRARGDQDVTAEYDALLDQVLARALSEHP